ncbi:hypothetical protein THAOC_19713, partial [Thalassiosira oceanica]
MAKIVEGKMISKESVFADTRHTAPILGLHRSGRSPSHKHSGNGHVAAAPIRARRGIGRRSVNPRSRRAGRGGTDDEEGAAAKRDTARREGVTRRARHEAGAGRRDDTLSQQVHLRLEGADGAPDGLQEEPRDADGGHYDGPHLPDHSPASESGPWHKSLRWTHECHIGRSQTSQATTDGRHRHRRGAPLRPAQQLPDCDPHAERYVLQDCVPRGRSLRSPELRIGVRHDDARNGTIRRGAHERQVAVGMSNLARRGALPARNQNGLQRVQYVHRKPEPDSRNAEEEAGSEESRKRKRHEIACGDSDLEIDSLSGEEEDGSARKRPCFVVFATFQSQIEARASAGVISDFQDQMRRSGREMESGWDPSKIDAKVASVLVPEERARYADGMPLIDLVIGGPTREGVWVVLLIWCPGALTLQAVKPAAWTGNTLTQCATRMDTQQMDGTQQMDTHNGWTRNGWTRNGWTRNGWTRNGWTRNGWTRNKWTHATDGHATDGHAAT